MSFQAPQDIESHNNNDTGNGSAGPSSQNANGSSADGKLNLDSHLSSMRSSVPDLPFDNTLASATASPSHQDTATSILQAQANEQEQHLQHLQQQQQHQQQQQQGESTPRGADESSNYQASNPAIDNLKEKDKAQPFSRSPELRISHKLAERKRRREMKDMFDELRVLLPSERSAKWSKWEILSKGIDYLEQVKKRNAELERDNTMLRRDLATLRGETQDDSLGDYAAAFKPGGVYGVPLDESSGHLEQSTGFENNGESSNSNNHSNNHSTEGPQIQPGLEDQEMPSEVNNEAPLDTDAIRESLTQVGERVE